MNAGDWIYWLGWIVVLATYVVMIYLTWWGLFGDKPHGRRRCPQCWYDLSHTPGMTCGECGRVARSERDLGRYRRRWGFAIFGIVISVAVTLFINGQIAKQGFTGLIPTKALIVSLPLMGNSNSSLCQELTDRARRSRLSDQEWAMLMRRCSSGDWWNEPASEAWEHKYGRYVTLRRWLVEQDPTLDWDSNIAADLLSMPPKILLAVGAKPPGQSPMSIRIHARDWWPQHWDMRLTVAPLEDPMATTTIVRHGRTRRDCWFSLGPFQEIPEQLDIELTVERRLRGSDGPWEQIQRESMLLSTNANGSTEDLMAPVGGLEIDEAMRRTFQRGVVKWNEGGPSPMRVYFSPESTYTNKFDNIAIGARVQILFDGDLARQLDMWWLAGVMTNSKRGTGWEASYERTDMIKNAESRTGRWQMRVTGDPALALRAGKADFYWDGEFTIPLMVDLRPGKAGPPGWQRIDQDDEGA